MSSFLFYVLAVLIIPVVVIVIIKVNLRIPTYPSLPPGPPAEPLIGHTRLIPLERQAEFYHEMRKSYGDVIHFKALWRSIVVLNSAQAATDLLDKRSLIYSDRSPFVMFVNILGFFPCLAFMEYGKRFHKHRKLFNAVFSRDQAYTFEHTQTQEARVLLKSLIETRTPESYNWLVRRYATTLVMKLAYGHEIRSDDDEYITMAENCSRAVIGSGSPGMTPPDFIPFLRHIPSWVPGAWWSQHGRDWSFAIQDIFNIPFNQVRRDMDNGTAQPSFVATHLAALAHEGVATQDDLDDIRGSAGTIYAAGMDTTWLTIMMFIFTMTLFPDKQAKAQREIDTIVGPDRLPEFSDRGSLPYLEAVTQEVLRWYPVIPLGIPHRVIQDDVFKGMFIPKGSIVVANALSMAWDDKIYADPTKFHPERFLPKSAGGNEEPYPIGTFGFGRRICPGRHVAEKSIWIVFATMLSALTISKAKDENGQEITPEIAFDVGLGAKPKDFKCVITPRSEQTKLLVMDIAAVRTSA